MYLTDMMRSHCFGEINDFFSISASTNEAALKASDNHFISIVAAAVAIIQLVIYFLRFPELHLLTFELSPFNGEIDFSLRSKAPIIDCFETFLHCCSCNHRKLLFNLARSFIID